MKRKKTTPSAPFNDNWKYLILLPIVLVYLKTVGFGFVLDDDLFIRNHPMVQKGVSTIPQNFTQGSMLHFKGSNFQIYRPFTVSFFTIQRSVFGFNPAGFHFMSVLLYALLCLGVYGLIRRMDRDIHPFYALAACLLFAVHPVHSEVVANIKSQDELLSAIGCILSLSYFLRYVDGGSTRQIQLSVLSFLVALFSKESAAAFAVVFPLTMLLLRRKGIREVVWRSMPLMLAALVFVFCRHFALQGLRQDFETSVIENVLYGAEGYSEVWATRMSILSYFLRLMVWPVGLSWDYSFDQIPLASWSEFWPIFSVVAFIMLILLALMSMRRQPIVSWGVGFFLLMILPTSNLFFLNGTTFAERFLFLPSVGWIIALLPFFAWACRNRLKDFKSADGRRFMIGSSIVLALCVYSASARVGDWRDNMSLFESGVRNAPRSSRAQSGLATEYMNAAEKSSVMQERNRYVESAKQHFKIALEIYPSNSNAAYRLGLIEAMSGDTISAIRLYESSLSAKPDLVYARVNLSTIYANRSQWDSAAFHLEKAFEADSLNQMVLANLLVVNFNRNRDDEVFRYYGVAQRNNLTNPKMSEVAGLSSGRSGKVR